MWLDLLSASGLRTGGLRDVTTLVVRSSEGEQREGSQKEPDSRQEPLMMMACVHSPEIGNYAMLSGCAWDQPCGELNDKVT